MRTIESGKKQQVNLRALLFELEFKTTMPDNFLVLRFLGSCRIRLCAACYVESPCHRMEWQFKQTNKCAPRSGSLRDRHQLRLLSECPNCKARFQIPALWVDGWCTRCFLPFAEMIKYQKPI